MKPKHSRPKRYRESTGRPVPPPKQPKTKFNAYRDYASVLWMGRFLKIFGVLLALVLIVFGVYVTTNGIIPYVKQQIEASSAAANSSSQASSEESETSSASEGDAITYDENGLPVYDNAVSLRVINKNHPAEADDVPQLAYFEGIPVDEKILPALRALCDAASADGVALTLDEGYISYEAQESAFNAAVSELEQSGMTHIMAMTTAEKQVGRPGICDFQTGLCVRFVSDGDFTKTAAYEWMNNNAMRYGFVFRYPANGEVSTGMQADLSVIRYVGSDNARQMRRLDMPLEDYIDYLSSQG